MTTKRRPNGYWTFVHVQEEIAAFNATLGTPGIMPRATQLEQAGLSGLLRGIRLHGGIFAVAERLGLQVSTKPKGWWDEFAHVSEALGQWIQEHGEMGVMPTQTEVNNPLRAAIAKHGGFALVAQRANLTCSRAPKGLWCDFVTVEQTIRRIAATGDRPDRMPSRNALIAAGYTGLADAIERYFGGYLAVARRLGLKANKPKGYWDEGHLREEVYAFLQGQGEPGQLPSYPELRRAHRNDLHNAIRMHGGYGAVAERLGLTCKSKSKG